jgi:hypothetical protein
MGTIVAAVGRSVLAKVERGIGKVKPERCWHQLQGFGLYPGLVKV